MKFFKPDDFILLNKSLCPNASVRIMLAECANAKLEKDGRVVYGNFYKGKFATGWCSAESDKWKIEKAILVNIESISEPCTHPKEKLSTVSYSYPSANNHFICECGAKLEPIAFEEIPKPIKLICQHLKLDQSSYKNIVCPDCGAVPYTGER